MPTPFTHPEGTRMNTAIDTARSTAAPAMKAITPPAIGTYWPGQGGIYVGIARGADGQGDRHLIAARADASAQRLQFGNYGTRIDDADSERDGAANTRALVAHGEHPAAAACAAYTADGHSDFYLPSRRELALCFANAAETFDAGGYYWSSTQYSRSGAFVQGFEGGGSGWYGKDLDCRVRACRGLPLEPLNTLQPAVAAEGGAP